MTNKSTIKENGFMKKAGRFFYLFDFIGSSKKLSAGTIALLVLNTIVPAFILTVLLIAEQIDTGKSIAIAAVCSIIGAFISLTPIGEEMASVLLRARAPKKDIANKAIPVFDRIHKAAMEENPGISKHVSLKVIKSGKKAKVFAAGRHIIIMNKAAAYLSDSDLEEEFAKAFAYIANRDADLMTFALAGNFATSFFFLAYSLAIRVVVAFTAFFEFLSNGLFSSLVAQIGNIIFTVLFGWMIKMCNCMGLLLVKKDLEKSAEYTTEYSNRICCLAAEI